MLNWWCLSSLSSLASLESPCYMLLLVWIITVTEASHLVWTVISINCTKAYWEYIAVAASMPKPQTWSLNHKEVKTHYRNWTYIGWSKCLHTNTHLIKINSTLSGNFSDRIRLAAIIKSWPESTKSSIATKSMDPPKPTEFDTRTFIFLISKRSNRYKYIYK